MTPMFELVFDLETWGIGIIVQKCYGKNGRYYWAALQFLCFTLQIESDGKFGITFLRA